jgi:NADPH:quinone reductase-like Zn-dependent oxidoreductase
MKALILKSPGHPALVLLPEPTCPPDYIKVWTMAVAVNSTDLDHLSGAGRVGGILGCDLSGIVVEVGEECVHADVSPGDPVYGVCNGATNSVSCTASIPFPLPLTSLSIHALAVPYAILPRAHRTGRAPSSAAVHLQSMS